MTATSSYTIDFSTNSTVTKTFAGKARIQVRRGYVKVGPSAPDGKSFSLQPGDDPLIWTGALAFHNASRDAVVEVLEYTEV
jgi:hypothetical protein